jgi:hypothetical protein
MASEKWGQRRDMEKRPLAYLSQNRGKYKYRKPNTLGYALGEVGRNLTLQREGK